MRTVLGLVLALLLCREAVAQEAIPGQSTSGGGGGGGAVNLVTGTAGQVNTNPTSGNVVVSLPSTITQAETFSAGLTVQGSFSATGLVTNADLVNAATTVNGQTCTLGSTCTVTVASALTIATTTIAGATNNDLLFDSAGVLGNAPITTFLAAGNGLSLSGTTTGTFALTAPVTVANGGTNETSQTANGVAYASDATHLTTGSTLVFTGSFLGVGTSSVLNSLDLLGLKGSGNFPIAQTLYNTNTGSSAQTVFYLGNNTSVNEGQILVNGGNYSNASLQNALELVTEAGKFVFSNNGTIVQDFGINVAGAWTFENPVVMGPIGFGGNSGTPLSIGMPSVAPAGNVGFYFQECCAGNISAGYNAPIVFQNNDPSDTTQLNFQFWDSSGAQNNLGMALEPSFEWVEVGHMQSDMDVDGYVNGTEQGMFAFLAGCLTTYNIGGVYHGQSYPVCAGDVTPSFIPKGAGQFDLGQGNQVWYRVAAYDAVLAPLANNQDNGLIVASPSSSYQPAVLLESGTSGDWGMWADTSNVFHIGGNYFTIASASLNTAGAGCTASQTGLTFTVNNTSYDNPSQFPTGAFDGAGVGVAAVFTGNTNGSGIVTSISLAYGGAYVNPPTTGAVGHGGVQLLGGNCTTPPTITSIVMSTPSDVLTATQSGGAVTGIAIPRMPTSAGTGGQYVCIDTSGNLYKKASCP